MSTVYITWSGCSSDLGSGGCDRMEAGMDGHVNGVRILWRCGGDGWINPEHLSLYGRTEPVRGGISGIKYLNYKDILVYHSTYSFLKLILDYSA